ncbi:MAG: GIY-YIG nuclease family protein [Candidatus Cloacimonetes bacterium]|nr:GIY-YIG nuclease family protein [Candidatus Cloacimonadota bacterium]
MFYVYNLQSLNFKDKFYIGYSTNLKSRIEKHNNGQVPHTSKFKPWKIKTYIAFEDNEKATKFEKYLKSHSGRAFVKNHF